MSAVDLVLTSPIESPTNGGKATVRSTSSDQEGRFGIGPSEVPRPAPSANPWIAPDQGHDEIAASETLWVYRNIDVRGIVHSGDPTASLNMKAVRILLIPVGDGLNPIGPDRRKSPGTEEWLQAHGLKQWPQFLARPGPDGRSEVKVPQIGGMMLVADSIGWRTASCPIAITGDSQEVDLVLRRGITLSGVFHELDGTPIEGARVVAYVTVSGDYSAGTPGNTRVVQPSGGMSGIRDRNSGSSRTSFHSDGRTDGSGRFRVSLKVDGVVRVCLYGDGHRPVDRELGYMDKGAEGLEFIGEKVAAKERIAFLCDNRRLSATEVVVSDQSGSFEQPSLSFHTDGNGEVSGDWFVDGKVYAFIAMGKDVPETVRAPRFLRWKGETSIDLALLPQERP